MKLVDYVPNNITSIPEEKAIFKVNQMEIDNLNLVCEDVKKQFHIDTATWGLIFWEERYGIAYNPSMSYEQRREIVKAKKRGQGTVTKAMIKNTAEAFSGGEVDVIEHDNDYYFTVKFVGVKGIPANMDAFENMLEDIKPAHMDYEFEYTYLIWLEFDNYNKTWDDWDALNLTWDDFEVYVEV